MIKMMILRIKMALVMVMIIMMMILRIKMALVMVMIIMMATKIGGSCVFLQATRTRATATALGSRRATPTPMPTAPPTTTMVSMISEISYNMVSQKKRYHPIFRVLYEGGGHGFYTSPSEGTKSSGGQV